MLSPSLISQAAELTPILHPGIQTSTYLFDTQRRILGETEDKHRPTGFSGLA